MEPSGPLDVRTTDEKEAEKTDATKESRVDEAQETKPTKTKVPESEGKWAYMRPEDVLLVGLDKIRGVDDPKRHPLYDKKVHRAVDPAKVDNVDRFGVREQVLVCREGSNVLCVAGRQRIKWARRVNELRKANKAKSGEREPLKVKVDFQRGDPVDLFSVTVLENEVREDENAVERAAKLVRYLEMGHSEREAASAFGVSAPTVENYKKLMELVPQVRQRIEDGGLTVRQALALVGLDGEAQRDAAAKAKAGDKGKHKGGRAPSKKLLEKVFDECSLRGGEKVEIVMRWVLGKPVTRAELASVFGGFEEVAKKRPSKAQAKEEKPK